MLNRPTVELHPVGEGVPGIVVTETEGEEFAIAYYNEEMSDDEGMVVISDMGAEYAYTAQEDADVEDEQHITGFGTEISANGNEVSLILPEERRKVLINVRGIKTTEEEPEKICDTIPAHTFEVQNPVVALLNKTGELELNGELQIAVGGPWVNQLAQQIEGNEDTTLATGTSYLIRDGNKLLAAGYNSDDTREAVDALIEILNG